MAKPPRGDAKALLIIISKAEKTGFFYVHILYEYLYFYTFIIFASKKG
jgi:hypothetical protein